MNLAAWLARLARRRASRERRRARSREETVEIAVRVQGTVKISYDPDGSAHSEEHEEPFEYDVGAPRPSDDDMLTLAGEAAYAALEAWAEREHPWYVVSASWTARTTDAHDEDEDYVVPLAPTDSDFWEGDGTLGAGEDGYIVTTGTRGYQASQGREARREGAGSFIPKRAPGRVWKVTRRSTAQGSKRRRRNDSRRDLSDFF